MNHYRYVAESIYTEYGQNTCVQIKCIEFESIKEFKI